MRTGNIGAFKLTTVASAYYKGDEKNPQLQRVYGTAFKTKKELDDYFAMLEEAKKRDHRKLGRELELFVFDDDVGPGLPMFLPRGAVIAEELEKLAKETEFAAGYQRVRTPHIARESLYKKSGHLPTTPSRCFRRWNCSKKMSRNSSEKSKRDRVKTDRCELELKSRAEFHANEQTAKICTEVQRSSMFRKLQDRRRRLKPKRIGRAEADRYYLKAMNCPHHHKLFAAIPRSYRDLPLRLAEYGT